MTQESAWLLTVESSGHCMLIHFWNELQWTRLREVLLRTLMWLNSAWVMGHGYVTFHSQRINSVCQVSLSRCISTFRLMQNIVYLRWPFWWKTKVRKHPPHHTLFCFLPRSPKVPLVWVSGARNVRPPHPGTRQVLPRSLGPAVPKKSQIHALNPWQLWLRNLLDYWQLNLVVIVC